MALTPASILADYSSGIGTQGATLKINTNEKRVGIGTTNPQGTLQVGTAITMGSGIITATSFDGNTATFSGNVSVGGTLTYEDVTSVDSVGIITARQDIHVGAGLSVVGVSTFNGITTSTTTLFANNFSVSGVSTLGGNVVVGGATTELVVTGDARVTGILTVGTASLTLNGTTGAITGSSLTNAEIAAISSEISDTAVDVFVYDTRKDSDGGAWRKRTQHTSWYNETLNTATRGSRKEFPAVAVIVAETDKVTIYDGDDPDLPMWMVFNGGSGGINNVPLLQYPDENGYHLAALNGVLVIGEDTNSDNYGSPIINFISEYIVRMDPQSTEGGIFNGGVAQRNDSVGFNSPGELIIISSVINDVAMTVLPNAPIDDATGLPIPTIAVATDGGVSIIKDDGTVVDGTSASSSAYSYTKTVTITEENYLWWLADNYNSYNTFRDSFALSLNTIPSSNFTWDNASDNLSTGTYYAVTTGNEGGEIKIGSVNTWAWTKQERNALGGPAGLAIHKPNIGSETNSLIVGITSSYNTGWMHGDIKGAFLSDTDATDATDSQRVDFNSGSDVSTDPVYGGVVGGTISNITTTSITIDATGLSGYKYYSTGFTPVSGKKYVAVITGSNYSGSGQYGLSIFGGWSINLRGTSNGTAGPEVTTSNGIPMAIFVQNGVSVTITLTIYELAEEDRSVNDKGLQVFGTITKSAVATGADLVAYSGFSASNYLEQPPNSDIYGFGAGDFSITFWTNFSTSASYKSIITISDGTAGGWGIRLGSSTPVWQFWDTNTIRLNSVNGINGWQQVAFVRSGTSLFGYVNGKLINSKAAYSTDLSSLSAISSSSTLRIGSGGNSGSSLTLGDYGDNIALLRLSASAPSAEQIKKIYEDEKVLFQENAKATLYGSSDAVTALAYDEDTNLLHVGTSSGRSDFQGLRRINNTTVGVTTAISASNGLVAEE